MVVNLITLYALFEFEYEFALGRYEDCFVQFLFWKNDMVSVCLGGCECIVGWKREGRCKEMEESVTVVASNCSGNATNVYWNTLWSNNPPVLMWRYHLHVYGLGRLSFYRMRSTGAHRLGTNWAVVKNVLRDKCGEWESSLCCSYIYVI